MADNDNSKNYDDLKARLGLNKASGTRSKPSGEAAPASSGPAGGADDVGEPPGERTPPGGFELGLERGGRELDETDIDIDKAAAQLVTEGGPAVSVKASTGMKIVMLIVVLAACGAAFGVGYSVKGTSYDREIYERQVEDAEKLKTAVSTAKTGNGGQPLKDAIDEYAGIIDTTYKKITKAQTAKEVTPALIKSLEGDLRALHKASIAYVEKGPLLGAHSAIGKTVFNGEAVKLILAYDRQIKELYTAAKMMAEEHLIMNEFKTMADPKAIKLDPIMRSWRYGQVTDKQGRPIPVLVGVTLQTDEKGEPIYQKVPIKVPEGFKLPEGAPTHEWKVKITYDDEKQVGKKEDFAPTETVIVWDLKDDVSPHVKEQVKLQQDTYKGLMLRRLFGRVEALRMAAEPLAAMHTRTVEKLAELAKE